MTFCINDYYYVRMDFCGDPDLPLLADALWGDIGMISFFVSFFCFCFLHIYNVFGCTSIINMCVSCELDVGPMRPDGKPRLMQRSKDLDAGETNQVLHQVERHLDRLTTTVAMAKIEDLPVAY